MRNQTRRQRSTPLEILIHLILVPRSSVTFSWQLPPEQLNRLADDLRWTILRRIFPQLNGKSPYGALLQKHAIKVESLDSGFFREILEVVREKYSESFDLNEARDMDDLECITEYFVPVILEWAENERSTSVSRERTPSLESLITHEDSCGNFYQRFPEDFAWAVRRFAPDLEPEPARKIPGKMRDFVHGIASALTDSLKNILESGRLTKYLVLMARLEDNTCTWDMTFDYLKNLGMKRYSSWKSLSVVANRALKDYVGSLPEDVRSALHQDDPELTREEKHDRLRTAVAAALEINPLPTPREIMAEATL